mmetsp:Transcript_23018/g.63930  ORF Transcript_23018/g.63930 Transcript_23018/m.63930 type:complete len:549 (+) Transcript_23018:38-1684(+)
MSRAASGAAASSASPFASGSIPFVGHGSFRGRRAGRATQRVRRGRGPGRGTDRWWQTNPIASADQEAGDPAVGAGDPALGAGYNDKEGGQAGFAVSEMDRLLASAPIRRPQEASSAPLQALQEPLAPRGRPNQTQPGINCSSGCVPLPPPAQQGAAGHSSASASVAVALKEEPALEVAPLGLQGSDSGSDSDTPLAVRLGNLKAKLGPSIGEAEGSERTAKRPRLSIVGAQRRTAKRREGPPTLADMLHRDAPALKAELEEAGLLEGIPLLDMDTSEGVYAELHETLRQICQAIPERMLRQEIHLHHHLASQQPGRAYSITALKCLMERCDAYSLLRSDSTPVWWGWCCELRSFVFAFEQANRIVLERPEYGMASYFFEMEQPMSTKDQVARLIACMSVPGIVRDDLLSNKEVLEHVDLSPEQEQVLKGCGWTPGKGLGSLLNFCERLVHDHRMDADEWKDKIAKQIAQGALMGRLHKTYDRSNEAGAPQPPAGQAAPGVDNPLLDPALGPQGNGGGGNPLLYPTPGPQGDGGSHFPPYNPVSLEALD